MKTRIAPLTRKNLSGVWHALIIPWNQRDELDSRRFAKDILAFSATGLSGLYTGGTTGEFYAQDDATYERVTRIACENAHAIGLPVQIGASALSTRTTRLRIKVAKRAKADALQLALPFWLALQDDEVKRYVREVAEEAEGMPIILYLTGRSKRKIAPDLLAEIADEVPTFLGTKDTDSDAKTIRSMLRKIPDLAIFGGEDFYERAPLGGRGGYCSVTGFNAPKVVELYRLCAAGRMKEAKPLAKAFHRFLYEACVPLNVTDGLFDSAIDRILRVAGGGNVGLKCQSPYRSGTQENVTRLIEWCRRNTPELLPAHLT